MPVLKKVEEYMLSTVLFISGKPVGYTVTIGKKTCEFKPTEHSNSEVQAPSFEIMYENNDWQFDPFFDWSLRNQILETFPFSIINASIKAELSAAP